MAFLRRRYYAPAMTIDLESRVLYRDGLILVIDKPAGIAVHSGPSGKPALEDSFDRLRFGLPRLPALAHRLDAGTSGCLVLGRHPKALRRLGRIFSQGLAEKTYLALTCGVPEAPSGRIDAPLSKVSTRAAGWRIVVDPEGKLAATRWRVLAAGAGCALLEATPETGRTHQIRVHLAHLGWPILGDRSYGGGEEAPMCLHAARIRLPLYPDKPPVDISAPLPPHMGEAMAARGIVMPAEGALPAPPAGR